MKNLIQACLFPIFMGYSFTCFSQGTEDPDTQVPSHISLENFPSDMTFNFIEGWGGMTVAVNEISAGTDVNRCQVPHWGYILKGILRLTYDDGSEVTLKEDDIFYIPPGHVAFVEADLKLMEFSPQEGFRIEETSK